MKNIHHIQEYVDSLLCFDVQRADISDRSELSQKIWSILTDPSRLARRPDPEFKDVIVGKIRTCVDQKSPIILVNAFGGFKNYMAPTFPHVDWSEVFALNKLARQCVEIAAVYEPGIRLEFTGDAEMATLINNYPEEAIETYVSEFKQLLAIFQSHLPKNVSLIYRGLDEFYDMAEFKQRILKAANEIDEHTVDEMYAKCESKVRNNFMAKGVKDYRRLGPKAFDNVLRRAVVLDHFYIDMDVSERLEYLEGGTHIPLIQTAIPGCIALKSVNTSKLAFWLGTGYLLDRGGRWVAHVQHGQRWQQLRGVEYAAVESPFSVIPGLDKVPYILSKDEPASDELVGAAKAAN